MRAQGRATKPWPPTREAILRGAGARAALHALTAKSASAKTILGGIYAVLFCARLERAKYWVAMSGMARHTLKRFPARLRLIADEIEHANRAPLSVFFFDQAIQLTLSLLEPPGWAPGLKPGGEQVEKELPELLRAYADRVDRVAAVLGKVFRRRPRLLNIQKLTEVALLNYVKMATGKYYWTEVTTLLSAAFYADGQDVTVTPGALQQTLKRTPAETLKILRPPKSSIPPASKN